MRNKKEYIKGDCEELDSENYTFLDTAAIGKCS